jgi:hypothetical protein
MKKIYNYNKGVNKKTKFLGVTLEELLFLLVGLVLLILFISILSTFGIDHWSMYFIAIAIATGGLFLLKYTNKQDHPTFIFSYLGFKFFQPERIHFMTPASYTKQMDATRKELAELRKNFKTEN